MTPRKRHLPATEESPFIFSDDECLNTWPKTRTRRHTRDGDNEGEREEVGSVEHDLDALAKKWQHRRVNHIDLEHTRLEQGAPHHPPLGHGPNTENTITTWQPSPGGTRPIVRLGARALGVTNS